MLGVVLAFASSVFWGASDFAGGVSARASNALHATLWSFVGATAASLVTIAVYQRPASSAAVSAGVLAGIFGVAGFLALYASLAAAPMGVVTVLVGAAEAIVPVAVGVVWYREALGPVAWVGVVVALVGAALIGMAEGDRGTATRGPLILAAASGALFGLSVVALDAAPADSGFVTPTVEVAVGLVLLLALAWAVGRFTAIRRVSGAIGLAGGPARPSRRAIVIALVAGLFFAAANITLLMALREGQLAVVGVVLCLYPVTTAILARVYLNERLTPKHLIGIVVALSGCALLAVG